MLRERQLLSLLSDECHYHPSSSKTSVKLMRARINLHWVWVCKWREKRHFCRIGIGPKSQLNFALESPSNTLISFGIKSTLNGRIILMAHLSVKAVLHKLLRARAENSNPHLKTLRKSFWGPLVLDTRQLLLLKELSFEFQISSFQFFQLPLLE